MADRDTRLAITDVRGGRNPVDPPQSLAPIQCAEAINVDWLGATLAHKRTGVTAITTTSSPFAGQYISSIFRHVPATDETAAELWAVDDATTPHIGRLRAGTAWASPTLKDAPTGNGWDFSFASLNGKLFIAYKTAVDRLHVWDPISNSVRRTGLAAPGTPTVANTGSGSYAATIQYVRWRVTEQRSGVTVRRSEASASTSITPSGTGTGIVITQGTVPGEGETHWEAEGSTDNATFYRLATIVIGTTTYTNTAAITTLATGTVSASAGAYGLQKSYRFIAADQGRLLGFGAWVTTNNQNRVEFSAVLGSTDNGDDERVPLNNYLGLDENASGRPTGLLGPTNGNFFAFKDYQVWRLTPTGTVTTPYQSFAISKVVGAVGFKAIVLGEDEVGNPCIYWMSAQGPYRYGAQGVEYLGHNIEDYTVGANAGYYLNLEANVVCVALWYPTKRQVFFWMATRA